MRKGFSLLPVLAILAIAGFATLTIVYYSGRSNEETDTLANEVVEQSTQSANINRNIATTNTNSVVTNTNVSTVEWKTYTNDTIGLTFQYPDTFGDPAFSEAVGDAGTTGKEFVIRFSKNENFLLGGAMNDYIASRGGWFLDTHGYSQQGGKYYYLFSNKPDTTYLVDPLDTLTVDGHDMILVDQYLSSFSGEGSSHIDGVLGALVNFSSASPYPGMAVWNKKTSDISRTEFEQILSTFQFTN